MLKKINLSNQKGDTIIEVMIVLAVLAFAISIAYSTANRSLLNARQAQENTEATQLVKAQVEGLRLHEQNTTSPSIYDSRPNGFCINMNLPTRDIVPLPEASPPFRCALSPLTVGITYNLLILHCNGSLNALCSGINGPTQTDTFVVQASWDDAISDERDTVTFVYRAHSLL